MSELDFEVAELPVSSPEIIDLTIESSEEKEITQIGAGLEQNASEIISDLEEGEIKEPEKSVCRYFKRGRCWLGKNCSFLHIGGDSYKMFDTQKTKCEIVYSPIITSLSMEKPSDAWDKGLKEAKKLLLNAKLKKEADLDFEEKQLYQGLDEIIRDNEDFYRRKIHLANRRRKRRETCPDCLRLKNSERVPKTPKTVSKNKICPRRHEKVKSRTRNSRSISWSPVPSRKRRSHSSNSSSFSLCGKCKASCYDSHESEKDVRKRKSKLERVFSRTIDAPKAKISRKRRSSRHTHSSLPRKRSLSRSSFIKRSYSKSPSPVKKEYLKKHRGKNVPHKQSTSPTSVKRKKFSSSYSKKERSPSPFSKFLPLSNARGLVSCSSDMTVSSIQCTSVSTSLLSSEEKEFSSPSKSPVVVSRRKSKDLELAHLNSYDIDRWLDTVPKSTSGSISKTTISTKLPEKNCREIGSSKPVEKSKSVAKPDWKSSSNEDTTDKELSADELELLKYVPNKNRKKFEQVEKKASPYNATSVLETPVKSLHSNYECGTSGENHSTKTHAEYPPPKILYDYGSDTESILSKLVNDCGSDRLSPSLKSVESNTESPVPNAVVDHPSPKIDLAHETNGENNFPKEHSNVERVNNTLSEKLDGIAEAKCPFTAKIGDAEMETPEQLDKNKIEQNNNCPSADISEGSPSSESSTELSEDELELLKYVSIRHRSVSEKIRKQTRKKPPDLNAKKTKQKSKSKSDASRNPRHSRSPRPSSAGPKKEKTIKILSRREILMQQLEAVELAIAEKKRQAKLDYTKLKQKTESLT